MNDFAPPPGSAARGAQGSRIPQAGVPAARGPVGNYMPGAEFLGQPGGTTQNQLARPGGLIAFGSNAVPNAPTTPPPVVPPPAPVTQPPVTPPVTTVAPQTSQPTGDPVDRVQPAPAAPTAPTAPARVTPPGSLDVAPGGAPLPPAGAAGAAGASPATTPPPAQVRTPTADWAGQQTVRNVKGNQTFAIDMNDPAFAGKQGVQISVASAKPRPGEYMNLMLRDKNGNVVKQQNSGGQGSGMGAISADGLPADQGPYTLDVETNMQDYHIQRNGRNSPAPGGELDPSYRPGTAAPPGTTPVPPTGGTSPPPPAPTAPVTPPPAPEPVPEPVGDPIVGVGRGQEPITEIARAAAPVANWFPANRALRPAVETGTPVNAVTNALLRRYQRPWM